MNVPVALQVAKRQTAEKRYAAEDDEEPTDDGDRPGAHGLDGVFMRRALCQPVK